MKLHLMKTLDAEEPEITIRYSQMTPALERVIKEIRQTACTLPGKHEKGTRHRVPVEEVLYIDTVDERTFLYTQKAVYETQGRLYQLEERLRGASFLRVSRNTLVNLDAIGSVRPLTGERMEITLTNGEKLVVTRHYLGALKAAFGL